MDDGTRPTFGKNVAALIIAVAGATVMSAQTLLDRQYADPRGRFAFSYPASFGAMSPGTDDGFDDRVMSIRFENFSSGVSRTGGQPTLGGEAVVTKGFPLIDLQAAGGLYDAITLQIFPDAMRTAIVSALPPLRVDTFCAAIGREQHLDPNSPALQSMTAPQRATVAQADTMRHANPRVLQCAVDGDTVSFDEEVSAPGGPRLRVYGAVRFLAGEYSTFQLVRGGMAPDPSVVATMTSVVKSWRPGR